MLRLTRPVVASLLLLALLTCISSFRLKTQSQIQVPQGFRSQRDTWTPLMDVLKDKRHRVTDEQLAKMKPLPVEAMWGAVQSKGYRFCFVNHLKLTQPGVKMVGRGLTMSYLHVLPDLDEGVRHLAQDG